MRADLASSRANRHWLLGGGLALLATAWLGPLPHLARHSFAAHMAMHMVVVALAAPLLAAALAGSSGDPVRRWTRGWRAALLSPLLASAIEFVVVWGWHAPALHHAARHSAAALWLEQGSFLAAGLLLWITCLGGDGSRERAAAGIAGLLLTATHMTLLGVLLALATRPLYAHAAPAGFDSMLDQQLGGLLMLGIGGAVYLGGALLLLRGLLRTPSRAPR